MSTQSQATEPVVKCPKCGNQLPLSTALTAPIEAEVTARLAAQYAERERLLQKDLEQRVLQAAAQAAEKAQSDQRVEVATLRAQVVEQQQSITRMEDSELSLRKRTRELETREKALALDVERQLAERIRSVEEETAARLAEQHRFKDAEKDKQLADVRHQLEEANRKAQQGSQQLQGEVAELDLEAQLRQAFPLDQFETVATGQRGADVLQRVVDQRGAVCGTIIWERKNAKSFSEPWIPKLREDQRASRAEVAVLVPAILPVEVRVFGQHGGVWIAALSAAVPLGAAIRSQFLAVSHARVVADGQAGKQAALMVYVAGTEFRQRVEAVLDPVMALIEDLEKERRALETNLARRGKRHQHIIEGIAGLWGDVSGIIGTLPTPKQLQLPSGEEGDKEAA